MSNEKYDLNMLMKVEAIGFYSEEFTGEALVLKKWAQVHHVLKSNDYTDEAKEALLTYANGNKEMMLSEIINDEHFIVGNFIENKEHLKTSYVSINPAMDEVMREQGRVAKQPLIDWIAEKLPDTDRHDIEVFVEYVWRTTGTHEAEQRHEGLVLLSSDEAGSAQGEMNNEAKQIHD